MFKMPWTRINELAAQVVEWRDAHNSEAKMHSHTMKERNELWKELESLKVTAEAITAQLNQTRQERDSAIDAHTVLSGLAQHRLDKIEAAKVALDSVSHDQFIKSTKALRAALSQAHDAINKAKEALCQGQEPN